MTEEEVTLASGKIFNALVRAEKLPKDPAQWDQVPTTFNIIEDALRTYVKTLDQEQTK